MRKFLHTKDVIKTEDGRYRMDFTEPLVIISGKKYNSLDEYLQEVYTVVFDTLVTLTAEARELRDELLQKEQTDKIHELSRFPEVEMKFPGNFNTPYKPVNWDKIQAKLKKQIEREKAKSKAKRIEAATYKWNTAPTDLPAPPTATTYGVTATDKNFRSRKEKPQAKDNKLNFTSENYTIEDAKKGLRSVYEQYGKTIAQEVEKMYILETTTKHKPFESKQYKRTGTPGMEAHGQSPYYGWSKKFFKENPRYQPIGTTNMYEGIGLSKQGGNKQETKAPKQYVIMPSVEAGMMYLANYIKAHKGNYARWNSTDPQVQEKYRKAVESLPSKLVNAIEKEN